MGRERCGELDSGHRPEYEYRLLGPARRTEILEASEFQIVQDYTTWTRGYDPQQRPNYMYIPTHYTQDQVSNYVPYLDIVPARAYADFAGQPHAWVRWRTEETLRGIQLANAIIGPDYLNGQKTPVGIVQLFVGTDGKIPSAAQTYHDFWQLIASGAQGVFVFSYFHRNDQNGALAANWNALQQAASEITGSELGSVILYGQPINGVTASVLSGPSQTVSFIPVGYSSPVQFPSIHLLASQWNGNHCGKLDRSGCERKHLEPTGDICQFGEGHVRIANPHNLRQRLH